MIMDKTEEYRRVLGEAQIALKQATGHHLKTCTCASCNALGSIEYVLSDDEKEEANETA